MKYVTMCNWKEELKTWWSAIIVISRGGWVSRRSKFSWWSRGATFLWSLKKTINIIRVHPSVLTQYLVIRLILVVFLLIVLLLVVLLILRLFCLLLLLLLAKFLILRFGLGNVVVFAASTGGHGDVLLDFNQFRAISLRYDKLAKMLG